MTDRIKLEETIKRIKVELIAKLKSGKYDDHDIMDAWLIIELLSDQVTRRDDRICYLMMTLKEITRLGDSACLKIASDALAQLGFVSE